MSYVCSFYLHDINIIIIGWLESIFYHKIIIGYSLIYIPSSIRNHIRQNLDARRKADIKEPCSWTTEGRPDHQQRVSSMHRPAMYSRNSFKKFMAIVIFIWDRFGLGRSRTLFLAHPDVARCQRPAFKVSILLYFSFMLHPLVLAD